MENEQPQIFFRSTDKPFTCADCLFIEFVDCLNLTYLPFLMKIQEANIPEDFPFDIDKIRCFTDLPSMLIWYTEREFQNPLLCLKKDEFLPDEVGDSILDKEISKFDEFITTSVTTPIEETLLHCISHNIAKRYVVYYPYYNPSIEKYIKEHFNGSVEYLYGDFEEEVLDKIPENNCTFFFSDIEKIQIMENNERMDYNTFIIPMDYQYNKDSDGNFLINLDELGKDHVFKYAYVNILE